MNSPSLTLRDALLALAIVFVWGINFAFIRIGLNVLPPLLFAALRFTFVAFPAVFFLPRPAISWRNLAVYGLSSGFGQFGLLFLAMDGMISPGLASLVIQMQAFFTIAIAMTLYGVRLSARQLTAFALAIAGMGVIAAHIGHGHGTTVVGLALTLSAAACWAVSNEAARAAGRPGLNVVAYVAWASLFSLPPLYLLSWLHEGGPAIWAGLSRATGTTWAVVIWQSAANTMFGYGGWAYLMARYPAATIAPLSLLVPVFGFAASTLLLGEPLESWKLAATALVMGGLAINLFWRKPA